jgi:HEPN domain-containing protein
MNEHEKEFIKQWLLKANEDYSASTELSKSELPLNGVICFHCQQSVEKFFKAYLIYRSQEVEKTHNTQFLRDACCKLDFEFCNIDIKDLNQFAVKARYPDDFLVPYDN